MKCFMKIPFFIKWFFIILNLFYVIKASENLYFNEISKFNIYELQEYNLKVESEYINKYIKIEVKSEKKNDFVLSAFQYSSKSERIQLAQGYQYGSILYLSAKQVKDEKIFIDLECSDYSSCSGTIECELQ